tara:strand:+ start:1289 stop:1795 length:507 start_codon:yes stop_codon:yes gene_type:complete
MIDRIYASIRHLKRDMAEYFFMKNHSFLLLSLCSITFSLQVSAEPLLDLANKNGRLLKSSTILDCRWESSVSNQKDGTTILNVHILDFKKRRAVWYEGFHQIRPEWTIFDYAVYEENDWMSGLMEHTIKDTFEDNQYIKFVLGKTEWVYKKSTKSIYFDDLIIKCRNL